MENYERQMRGEMGKKLVKARENNEGKSHGGAKEERERAAKISREK